MRWTLKHGWPSLLCDKSSILLSFLVFQELVAEVLGELTWNWLKSRKNEDGLRLVDEKDCSIGV